MQFLKQRHAAHAVYNQPRAHRLAVIRWLYISGIFALAIWLVNFSFGSLLYLQSDGLVLGEPGVVAAEFPVTVRDVLVREGQIVEKGQIAAIVSSQNVTELIARLTADLAARQVRRGELRIRSEVVNGLLALAQNRQKVASGARERLETLLPRGELPLNEQTAALDMEFRSYQDLAALVAEKPIVEAELGTLSAALAEAEGAIADLRKLYDNGRLRVPIDGVISHVIATKGAVVRAGEPLVELCGSRRFVLAYLPSGAAYNVAVGDEVQITAGFQVSRGVITRVEPFAAALPREFQRAFTPVETEQVIRVEFAPGAVPPPLFTKVSLHSFQSVRRSIERIWRAWWPWPW